MYHRSSSVHVTRRSRYFTLLRLPCNAWQAVAEVIPIRLYRHARDLYLAQPEPAEETQWHHRMVPQPPDGITTVDATSRAVAAWLCSLYL